MPLWRPAGNRPMKIAILGTSGSGKSTLAQKLGAAYNAPVLHLDAVHFLPGWVERPQEEMQALVQQFMDTHDSWVIDGHYSNVCYDRRLEEADQIIVLCFNRFVCLWRVICRWWENRGRVRSSSAPGCEEKSTQSSSGGYCIRGAPRPGWKNTAALVSSTRKSLFFSKTRASLNDF